MAVPKCKECEYVYKADMFGKSVTELSCKHPSAISVTASLFTKQRNIFPKEMGKTSPKWCPKRERGDK